MHFDEPKSMRAGQPNPLSGILILSLLVFCLGSAIPRGARPSASSMDGLRVPLQEASTLRTRSLTFHSTRNPVLAVSGPHLSSSGHDRVAVSSSYAFQDQQSLPPSLISPASDGVPPPCRWRPASEALHPAPPSASSNSQVRFHSLPCVCCIQGHMFRPHISAC